MIGRKESKGNVTSCQFQSSITTTTWAFHAARAVCRLQGCKCAALTGPCTNKYHAGSMHATLINGTLNAPVIVGHARNSSKYITSCTKLSPSASVLADWTVLDDLTKNNRKKQI